MFVQPNTRTIIKKKIELICKSFIFKTQKKIEQILSIIQKRVLFKERTQKANKQNKTGQKLFEKNDKKFNEFLNEM